MSGTTNPGAGSGSQKVRPSSSRYELLVKIASGGMATVYVGRLRGAVGFWRLVAIKRAHPHLLEDPAFKQMLIEEARLASRIHHPNVVAVLDVEELSGELRLVMDYVEGASLADLLVAGASEGRPIPARLAVRIALDACAGLLAAHELRDEDGSMLHIVHRDVSPQNILVGLDGMGRLSDFGIAKHARSGVSTTTGSLKGKLGYMSPEYIETGVFDVRGDVFAMGVVVWEALANRKLFRGTNEVETLRRIVDCQVPPLSSVAPWVGGRLDTVVAAALAKSPEERFQTAGAFAAALETVARKDDLIGSHAEVAAFVKALWGARLDARRAEVRDRVAKIEAGEASEVTGGFGDDPLGDKAQGGDGTGRAGLRDRAGDSGGSTATITPGLARAITGVTGAKRGASWMVIASLASVAVGGLLAYFVLRSPRGVVVDAPLDGSAAPTAGEAPIKGADVASASITALSPSSAAPLVTAAPSARPSADPIASAAPSVSAKAGRPGAKGVGTAAPKATSAPKSEPGSDGETIAPNPYQKPTPTP